MAKVAWTQVCLPTKEGGLGLKRVREGLKWGCNNEAHLDFAS